jgi:hypothetical protein
MWGGPFAGQVVLPAFGTSGGILLMWDKRVVECLEEAVGSISISCKFKSILEQFVWAFSGIYGPIDNSECFGKNYLGFFIGGILLCGALEVTLMLPDFRMSAMVLPIQRLLW